MSGDLTGLCLYIWQGGFSSFGALVLPYNFVFGALVSALGPARLNEWLFAPNKLNCVI